MDVAIVILMFLALVFGHEMAHVGAAIAQGKKVKSIYLGIPVKEKLWGKERSSIFYAFKFRGVEIGFSWLILGGAVEFDDFDNATLREKIIFFAAGPFANLVVALIPLIIVLGPSTAFLVTFSVIKATLIALLGLAVGSSEAPLLGPIGAVVYLSQLASVYGYLFVWILLNLTVMTFNLLPFPVLDGGQMLMAVVIKIFGEKAKKPVAIIGRISFYILIILIGICMTLDLWL